MSFLRIFSRLSLSVPAANCGIHTGTVQFIRTTPILCAEPLKKKKKIDPQVIKQREERRKKKIEKQIRRLEKNARQLKPIEELEVPLSLIDEKDIRTRPAPKITPEMAEQRVLLEKKWATYKMKEKMTDLQTIDRLMYAQDKALSELRFESEELYQEAIKPDMNLVPFTATGPVSTPPIDNYESPDGEYIDISTKYE